MRSRYLITNWSGMAPTWVRERHVGRHRLGAPGTEPRQSGMPHESEMPGRSEMSRRWRFGRRGRHRPDSGTSVWPPATAS